MHLSCFINCKVLWTLKNVKLHYLCMCLVCVQYTRTKGFEFSNVRLPLMIVLLSHATQQVGQDTTAMHERGFGCDQTTQNIQYIRSYFYSNVNAGPICQLLPSTYPSLTLHQISPIHEHFVITLESSSKQAMTANRFREYLRNKQMVVIRLLFIVQ